MFTFLDLLVIVFMVLTAASLLSICLMFLSRKPLLKKISFYIVVALGIFVCSVSLRILSAMFPVQFAFGIAMGVVSIAALMLELLSKGDHKKARIAHIMAAVSLVAGVINAFMV